MLNFEFRVLKEDLIVFEILILNVFLHISRIHLYIGILACHFVLNYM